MNEDILLSSARACDGFTERGAENLAGRWYRRAMAFADRLPIKLPRFAGRRNLLRDAWNLLAGMPGGKAVFSRLVGRLAPYTGSIHATVTVLRAGYAEVQ